MMLSAMAFGSLLTDLGIQLSTLSYVAGGSLLAGLVVEFAVLFFLLRMLSEAGALGENYQGEDVPIGSGISFAVTLVLIFGTGAILQKYQPWPLFSPAYLAYLLGIVSLAMLGFIDDILGNRENTGWIANLIPLLRGRMSTGTLKIAGCLVIAFLIAFITTDNWLDCGINTLLMAIFATIMNWMDLQPGRAIKGYFLLLAAVALIALGSIDYILIAPLTGAVLCYLPYDFRFRAIMGDAGSSVMGFSLGFLAASSLSLSARVALLLFIVVSQIIVERFALADALQNASLISRVSENSR